MSDEKIKFVADKARETFEKIKEVRKNMPNKFKWQRDLMDKSIKELEAQWWEDVKDTMVRSNPGSVREYE